MTSVPSTDDRLSYTAERLADLKDNYASILSQVEAAASSASRSPVPLLLPISKLKPASDIAALYSIGVRDFGENYVQELQEKAELFKDFDGIRWHFVGGLQTNKCKGLAGTPNLHTVHTIDSTKKADLFEKALSSSSSNSQIHIYIQINTSLESSKSGLRPPFALSSSSNSSSSDSSPSDTSALDLACHIACRCPHLRLLGLMCIGALEGDPKRDFEVLCRAREGVERHLAAMNVAKSKFGPPGREDEGLDLSMGMSGDFEEAIKMGSGVVRVGTSIFGQRPKKGEEKI